MAVRHAALLLCPLMAWAQTPAPQATPAPPAAVDQALRARVSEFLQYFVDGQFRKALKLVADDSQDLYFGSSKAELKAFRIDDIKYDTDFQKAVVFFTVDRTWKAHFEGLTEIPLKDIQMSSTWKIEDGQWAWYYKPESEPWITAMGPSNAELISRKPDGTVVVPKINQDTADAAAGAILHQTKLDRNKATLRPDKASSDKIFLHNGVNGQISVELLDVPKFPGFSVKLNKASLNAGEDAEIEISYDPPADVDPNFQLPSSPLFGVVLQPFQQTLVVEVEFAAPDKK